MFFNRKVLIWCDTPQKHLCEVLLMSTTTYVFVEKYVKYWAQLFKINDVIS